MSSGFDDVVSFAIVPDPPRMFPPVEALVVQQADPRERAVSRAERARRDQGRVRSY
ncbi:hypothetical protein FHS07_001903 [Microbacterium proteolyticum]|uniref:Uncharacterized protein n=1 Tax=Microbacterium proteolyticum TaxID=1572644 RepID=A0A7W5CI99_9MICO|nr:hypothetical protein [Microbacterium proteolyticum]MBB3158207.1 hypothetical protein [Microbacterium proteolyticum]